MNIKDKVELYNTGDPRLDSQTGTLVGYHGNDFPIVLFDGEPKGYPNPAICIITIHEHYCEKKV